MRDYFEQTRSASQVGLHLVALGAALAIPDMCSAMESSDGLATKQRYIAWFDQHVAPRYSGFVSGEDCYLLRCSMLHQGTTQHPKGNFSRILFTEGGGLHNNIMNDALNLDVALTPEYQANFPRFIQRYPHGLAPFIVGAPVIS